MKELKLVATIAAVGRFYQGLALSPTGLLAANGETLDVFDVAATLHNHASCLPEPVYSLSGSWRAKRLAWSPDGKRLAYVTREETGTASQVVIFDVAKREDLTRHTHHGRGPEACVDCVAWSPDGNYIASTTEEDQLHLWHADSGALIKTRSVGYPFHFLCWSPDKRSFREYLRLDDSSKKADWLTNFICLRRE